MNEPKDPVPPTMAVDGPTKRGRTRTIKKLKERIQGNTVYSIGFRSDHKEDEEEPYVNKERPPPWAIYRQITVYYSLIIKPFLL